MVKVPSKATLTKYGLTEEEWLAILERQGGVCPICKKIPTTGRFVVDHEHVQNYKKLPREEKKKFIRGITDWFCNHAYLGRGITVDRSRNATKYLEEYEQRRPPRKI